MSELDNTWSEIIVEATDLAETSGRQALADYLRLRASNDLLRRTGVEWLFRTMIDIAGPTMSQRPSLLVDRYEPHNFVWHSSNMVGYKLEFRLGVRCLTMEAGWARNPSDGIMRRGALAFARISHFGISKATGEYRLFHGDPVPQWLDDNELAVSSEHLERHFSLFAET